MVDEDGAPLDVELRNVLNRLWQQLRQRGCSRGSGRAGSSIYSDRKRDAEGYLQPPCAPGTGRDRNTCKAGLFRWITSTTSPTCSNDIDELALQLIPADGAVAAASPGQF